MAALPLHHWETLLLASIPTNLAFQRVESSGFQPFFVQESHMPKAAHVMTGERDLAAALKDSIAAARKRK
jgi:hypothetical protein